jgi:hypothetical protein
MRKLSEAYKSFLDGDKLTDKEVIALRDQLKLVAYACLPLRYIFRFPFIEASQNYLRLMDICKERGISE